MKSVRMKSGFGNPLGRGGASISIKGAKMISCNRAESVPVPSVILGGTPIPLDDKEALMLILSNL